MLLREKGNPDGPRVGMGWDEAQAALQAGTHEVAEGNSVGGGESADEDAVDAQTKADLVAALRRA